MIHEVKNDDLGGAKGAKLAVLDFNATWCGPCKMLGPILAEVSEEMKDVAEFYGIDVDENQELAGEYGVQSIPTLVLLKNGQKVDQKIGFMPKENIVDFIRSAN